VPHRIFTRAEADALVPYLSLELGRLTVLQREIEALSEELGGGERAIELLGQEDAALPPAEQAALTRLHEITAEVHAAVERLGSTGVVLEDLREGLVDFYARDVDERMVFLCWCLGEPAVAHVHGLQDGVDGRRPIAPCEGEGPAN
jgi:hypothetical protein